MMTSPPSPKPLPYPTPLPHSLTSTPFSFFTFFFPPISHFFFLLSYNYCFTPLLPFLFLLFPFFFFSSYSLPLSPCTTTMGNVNGRDDVNGSPSETEGEEEEDDDEAAAVAPTHGVADCMSANPGYRAPSDMMGHSPPASPRTTQSPFMFAPQVNPLFTVYR